MTQDNYPISKFKNIETPFYFYNVELLKETINAVKKETEKYGYIQHYAIKANANPRILQIIAESGFGADCVSGNEIKAAVNAGFSPTLIVFAGVGKTDKEINLALDYDIHCFNTESLPELAAINYLAGNKGKKARIALRINPNVDAHTHEYITTGLNENKFGFNIRSLPIVIKELKKMDNLLLSGIHFHIGSQITDTKSFQLLSEKVNELQDYFEQEGIRLTDINVGGGLGIDYDNPDLNSIPDFESYFRIFHKKLKVREGQQVHFELGRAIVGQCGTLIASVTYVKEGDDKHFAILDAGMTDLIRPALYKAYHKIENLTSSFPQKNYDIVGPICESSDTFAKDYPLNETKRGDLIAIRSAGAYSEVMALQYNCRDLPIAYFSDKL